jgi:hypothetical protein
MRPPEYTIQIEGKDYTCYQARERLYFLKDGKWHIVTNQYPRLTYEVIDGRKVPQKVRVSAS